MKSMEEYINDVYEKYQETEANHQKYKKVKVKYNRPLNKLCGVVACVALILTFFIGVKYFETNTKEEIRYVSSGELINDSIIYTEYIWVDGKFDVTLKPLMRSSDCIVVTKDARVINYVASVDNSKIDIVTLGELQVDSYVKGHTNEKKIKYCKQRWMYFFQRVRRKY